MLLYISFSLLTAYCIIMSILNGVSTSLSYTYFLLGKDMRRIAFGALFITFSVTLGIYCNHWLMWLSTAGMILVGANPNYKRDGESKWHYFGAGSAAVCSQAYLLTLGLWPVVAASCALMLILTKRVNNSIWWVEMVAFYSVYIALLWIK